MNLTMVGINFRTSPLEFREQVSFRESDLPDTLNRLKEHLPGTEIVLLSTCNRTELYVSGPNVPESAETLTGILTDTEKPTNNHTTNEYFYRKEDTEAVEHLCAVASGLDAMVVGETEVLGQLKRAYVMANEAGTVGTILHSVFQRTFKVAKHIHTKTGICRGHVSVSSIAVEFAEKVFDNLSSKTVMIIGAGETSELTLQSLIEKGVRETFVLNRSIERGKALAEKYNGKAIQLDFLSNYLPSADIVISSTNAPHCVIHTKAVREAVAARHGRPMLLIDIAVPRDIESAVGQQENVYLYNIDDLQDVAAENLARRQDLMEQARSIIREQTAEFEAGFGAKDLGEVIKEIDESARTVKEAELSRALALKKLRSLPKDSKEEIRTLVNRTVNRLLHQPKKTLQETTKNGQGPEYLRVVRRLFGLGKKDSEKTSSPRKGEDRGEGNE